MSKKCFIIGCEEKEMNFAENSIMCDEFKDKIKEKLTELVENGKVYNFITCMRKGADTYAAEAVLELKHIYPEVSLQCMIPFEEQATDFTECERNRYFGIIERCDSEVMFSKAYAEGCIERCLTSCAEEADVLLYLGLSDLKLNNNTHSFIVAA